MIAWLLLHWKFVATGAAFTVLGIVAGTYRIQRDQARASLVVVRGTIVRMDAAGRAQALVSAQTNLQTAAITKRTTDALTAQLADANERGDAVARRLRILLATRHDCTLPGVTVTAAGLADTPGATGSPEAADAAVAAYTRASEADSARLAAWQAWYREQEAAFRSMPP